MWLNLEVGTARSLHRRFNIRIAPPLADRRSNGWQALVIEAAHTYFPEAAIESLPEIAAAEVALGLTGRLRTRIAETDAADPVLPVLRDELIARLGGIADATGALTVVDRVYASRLLRHQVPPIIAASCLTWYGQWRTSNAGPALETAAALQHCVTAWIAQPGQRAELDAQIVAHARAIAPEPHIALEELAEPSPVLCRSYAGASTGCDGVSRSA